MPHTLNKLQCYIDTIFDRVTGPLERLDASVRNQFLRRHADRLVLPLCALLAKLRLGTLSNTCDARDTIRTRALFDGAGAAGVELLEFRPFNMSFDGIFIARKGTSSLVFFTMPRPRLRVSPFLDWIDDKGKVKSFFLRHGIPVPQGEVATNFAGAESAFERVGPPVITKPQRGSRSRHTIIGIDSREALRRAFAITKQISPYVVVEKELLGGVHRVTLVGGAVAAVCIRDFAHVVGDGTLTIRQLIDRENKSPLRDGFFFFPIPINDAALDTLKEQGKDWDSVPQKDERVVLHKKVSRLYGSVTVDVTDIVHPDNTELFERIGSLMQDPIIGVDFMISDISKPWHQEERSGVIELNTMPYIDLHHYVYQGTPRNVAKQLWEYVFEHGEY